MRASGERVETVGPALTVVVLPILAVVWPALTVAMARNRPGWRRWGVGGCLLLAVILVPLGPFIAGTAGDDTVTFVFMGAVAWLLGGLNAAAGLTVGLVVPSGRSWTFLSIPSLVAILTFAGSSLGTWPDLPALPQTAQGQVTGVVATTGFFGTRSSDAYDAVAAVPEQHLDAFFTLNVGGETDVPERTPTYFTIGMDREALEQVDGLRLAPVEDGRFVIDGLDADNDYWFCAGEHDADMVEFAVCDAPDVSIPGSLIAYAPGQASKIAVYPND